MVDHLRGVTGDWWRFKGGFEICFYRPCFWDLIFRVREFPHYHYGRVLEIETPLLFIGIPRPKRETSNGSRT